jgi:phospholipid:diacylglycerol acyltransferase
LILQIELFYNVYGEGVLLAAHSWGDNVARSFLTWMEERERGWVDKHVAIHFNIAGPTLGVPKALTSLLSGVAIVSFASARLLLRVYDSRTTMTPTRKSEIGDHAFSF